MRHDGEIAVGGRLELKREDAEINHGLYADILMKWVRDDISICNLERLVVRSSEGVYAPRKQF